MFQSPERRMKLYRMKVEKFEPMKLKINEKEFIFVGKLPTRWLTS